MKKIVIEADAKPCPFCGGVAESEKWHGGGPRKTLVACGNENCHAGPDVVGSTRQIALRRWNTRAPGAER